MRLLLLLSATREFPADLMTHFDMTNSFTAQVQLQADPTWHACTMSNFASMSMGYVMYHGPRAQPVCC